MTVYFDGWNSVAILIPQGVHEGVFLDSAKHGDSQDLP